MRASGGNRIGWEDVPVGVRRALESALGSRVLVADNQAGGFSPGLAARCRLDDGRRIFVKAVSPAQNPHACRIHRREAEIAARLPADFPSPTLRHVHDDGTWVALVFDDVDGRQPAEPWREDDLALVLGAIAELGSRATPSPVPSAQTIADRYGAVFDGWRRLHDGDGRPDALDPWARGHLDRLASIEAGWVDAATGTTLLHTDLRADNLLIDRSGAVWFIDWPWACNGAPFVDPLFLLPSVGLGGGPAPHEVVEQHRLFSETDPEAILAVTVAMTGFFLRSAMDPAPPGLPTVRAFQRAQGEIALDFVRRLLGDRP